jgi:hypothetical protein
MCGKLLLYLFAHLKSANTKNVADPANLLERKAAISFFLPDGYVHAVYDNNGKLIRTAERYKNISLPAVVRHAVAKRYPNWGITKDVYQVKYEDEKGARTIYKLSLQNENKLLKTKTD